MKIETSTKTEVTTTVTATVAELSSAFAEWHRRYMASSGVDKAHCCLLIASETPQQFGEKSAAALLEYLRLQA